MNTRPRIALITGGSAGIGTALGRLLARRGWRLAIAARHELQLTFVAAELKQLGAPEVWTYPLDLSEAGAPVRLVRAMLDDRIAPDVLINNAGYSRTEDFLAIPPAEHAAMLRLMIEAPVMLNRILAPSMILRRYGRILNVASLAGTLPATGGDTLYGPIKSFLIKASQGLHLELQATGVHVTALCPGYTLTEFHDANGSRETVGRGVPKWMWSSAEDVAEAGWRAVERNDPVCVPGLANKALSILPRLLPTRMALKLVDAHARRLRGA